MPTASSSLSKAKSWSEACREYKETVRCAPAGTNYPVRYGRTRNCPLGQELEVSAKLRNHPLWNAAPEKEVSKLEDTKLPLTLDRDRRNGWGLGEGVRHTLSQRFTNDSIDTEDELDVQRRKAGRGHVPGLGAGIAANRPPASGRGHDGRFVERTRANLFGVMTGSWDPENTEGDVWIGNGKVRPEDGKKAWRSGEHYTRPTNRRMFDVLEMRRAHQAAADGGGPRSAPSSVRPQRGDADSWLGHALVDPSKGKREAKPFPSEDPRRKPGVMTELMHNRTMALGPSAGEVVKMDSWLGHNKVDPTKGKGIVSTYLSGTDFKTAMTESLRHQSTGHSDATGKLCDSWIGYGKWDPNKGRNVGGTNPVKLPPQKKPFEPMDADELREENRPGGGERGKLSKHMSVPAFAEPGRRPDVSYVVYGSQKEKLPPPEFSVGQHREACANDAKPMGGKRVVPYGHGQSIDFLHWKPAYENMTRVLGPSG